MFILYIVVVAFVIALLLSIPLFPFWKVWERLKTHHPDIWHKAGPFDVLSMVTSPGVIGIFLKVLIRMETDKELHARDPYLGKWCRLSMELLRMMPRTFLSQTGCFLVFFYFTSALSRLLMSPFRH